MSRLNSMFAKRERIVCNGCGRPGVLRKGDRCSICGFLSRGKHHAVVDGKSGVSHRRGGR
jgi:ribosomal protein L37E